MHPRQLTNEELANELAHIEGPLPYEASLRLVGQTQASWLEKQCSPTWSETLVELLGEEGLDDPAILKRELENIDEPIQLSDFYESDYWQRWDSENRSELSWRNPDRAERLYEAAEHGADGSTHREVIEDWRQALNDAPFSEFGPISKMLLHLEITRCYEWHRKNGSLDDQIG